MPSPPKPWEVNSGTAVASTPVVSQSAVNNSMADITTTTTSSVPTVPNRPSTMGTTMGNTMGTMGTMGMGGMSSGYGGKNLFSHECYIIN